MVGVSPFCCDRVALPVLPQTGQCRFSYHWSFMAAVPAKPRKLWRSASVPIQIWMLACFNPLWPNLIFTVAWFALAMFKLIAVEDVQHAGEGRVVRLHYIPNGPGSVCKNRHDEARIFVA